MNAPVMVEFGGGDWSFTDCAEGVEGEEDSDCDKEVFAWWELRRLGYWWVNCGLIDMGWFDSVTKGDFWNKILIQQGCVNIERDELTCFVLGTCTLLWFHQKMGGGSETLIYSAFHINELGWWQKYFCMLDIISSENELNYLEMPCSKSMILLPNTKWCILHVNVLLCT